MTDISMTPLETSLAKSCQPEETGYLNRRVPSLKLLTFLEFILIMLTIPLAAVDITEEKAGAIARNVDILLLIGLGVLVSVALYFIVEKMITNRVQMLEAKQDAMAKSLEYLTKRMDIMFDMITNMQISQEKTLSKMLSGQDLKDRMFDVLACHERDCPARQHARKD